MAGKPNYGELELRVKELEMELRDAKQAEEMLREAQNIRQLLKFAPFGVYLIDLSGKIVACNESGAERLGKTIETSVGTVLRDHFRAEVADNKRLKGMEAIQSRKTVTFEDQAEGRWYRNSIFPLFDDEGRPIRLAIYGTDVTAYKNALDSLEKSEEKYRQLSDLLPQVVFETDEMGNLTFTNQMAFDLFGYTRADFEKGLNAPQMLIPEDRERAVRNMQTALRGEKLGGTEYTALTKDGRTYPVMIYSHPVIKEGKPAGLRGIMVDITEGKRDREALHREKEKFRVLVEESPLGISLIGKDGRYEYINPRFTEIFGYNLEDIPTGREWFRKAYPDQEYRRQVTWAWINDQKTAEVGEARPRTYVVTCKDGSEKTVNFRPVMLGTGEQFIICEDITQQKIAEEALRESEERYRKLIEASNDGIAIIRDDKHIYVNQRFLDIFGYDTPQEVLGKSFFVSVHPDDLERVTDLASRRQIGDPVPSRYEFKGRRKNGQDVFIEVSAAKAIYKGEAVSLAYLRDVTERRHAEEERTRLEAQLQQAQKMESMGLLAGGVAHDLNNILSGIVSYPELLLMDLPEDSPLRKPIKTIQESGMRAADVVADLLTIARGVATGKEALNLNRIVNEYLGSAEFDKLEKTHAFVDFRTELDSDLLNIRGSSIHIKKVLMNLVVNATEAIEGSGTVIISTRNRYLDEPVSGYEDVRQGEYVVLSVSDNGSGISPEDMEKIFEPFYTKKVMGRSGTGLGLAVVWNTVQDHNGYIRVKSSEKGTVFGLYFPVTREEIADEKEPVDLQGYLGRGEKILVVDDEERQREIACGMLTKLGYNPESVSSGEEAVEYVKKHPVDLIVLDMIMPKGINGRETYEEIIKIRPGQKAVIASGFAKTREVDAAQDLGAGNYIKKPYILEKIGVTIKRELEEQQGES